jgi:serine/threonine-protein kinase RsbW
VTGETYELTGLAVPEDLEQLHDLLEKAAAEHPRASADDVMMFETAVMELANNVVEHVAASRSVRWGFRLEVRSDALYAELFDSGEVYAGWQPEQELEMPDPLAESGRGLPLASAVLDDLGYHRVGGINVWTMLRRFSS